MIVVVGAGSHAHAVAALIGGAVVRREDYVKKRGDGCYAVVGMGCSDMAARRAIFRQIGSRVARLFAHRSVGDGTVVFPNVTLGNLAVIGRNVVIYSGSVVEHGSTVGDHAWLSPGVILCGNVTVKPRAFLGAGAIVLPGVTIGEGARIGAGAVIHHDVPNGATVHGPRSAHGS